MENKYLDKIRSSVENELRTFITSQPVMEIGDENVALLDQVELALYPALKTYLRTFNVNVFTITAENLDEDKPADLGDHDFVINWGQTRHGEYVHVVKLGIESGLNISFMSLDELVNDTAVLYSPILEEQKKLVKRTLHALHKNAPKYKTSTYCDKGIGKLAHYYGELDVFDVALALKTVMDKDFYNVNPYTLKDSDITGMVGSSFCLTTSNFNGIYMVVRK